MLLNNLSLKNLVTCGAFGIALAGCPAPTSLNPYLGTYYGFIPTDESAVMVGEAKLVLGEEEMTIEHATGLEIQKETVTYERFADEYRELSREEILKKFKTPEDASYVGVAYAGVHNPDTLFLFYKEPLADGDLALIWYTGGVSDINSPGMFLNQAQVNAGKLEALIDGVTKEYGREVVPRLKYNGLTKEAFERRKK